MSCRYFVTFLMCFQPCEQIKKKRLLFMGNFSAIIPQSFVMPRHIQVSTLKLRQAASRLAKLTTHYCVSGGSVHRCFSSARCQVIMLFSATNISPNWVWWRCACVHGKGFQSNLPYIHTSCAFQSQILSGM